MTYTYAATIMVNTVYITFFQTLLSIILACFCQGKLARILMSVNRWLRLNARRIPNARFIFTKCPVLRRENAHT